MRHVLSISLSSIGVICPVQSFHFLVQHLLKIMAGHSRAESLNQLPSKDKILEYYLDLVQEGATKGKKMGQQQEKKVDSVEDGVNKAATAAAQRKWKDEGSKSPEYMNLKKELEEKLKGYKEKKITEYEKEFQATFETFAKK